MNINDLTTIQENAVVWSKDNSGYGWRKTKYGGYTCCTLEIGIRDGIRGYFNHICLRPMEIQQLLQEKKENKKITLSFPHSGSTYAPLFSLNTVYPQIGSYFMHKFNEVIMNVVWDYLYEIIPTVQLSPDLDNYTFLVKIGSMRNWTKDCVICLNEKTGHVCNCGHSDIVIFRPCGHTMCKDPCYKKYKKKYDVCPVCKNHIDKVFSNNSVWFSSKSIDGLVDIVKNKVGYLRD